MMKPGRLTEILIICLLSCCFFSGCNTGKDIKTIRAGREPVIDPDYSGVTIPVNIAPMNFIIGEKGSSFMIKAVSSNGYTEEWKSSNGMVRFRMRAWKKLLENINKGTIGIRIISESNGHEHTEYEPVIMNITGEAADPYLCYRLLYPGYESWVELKIVERNVENFRERSVFENQLLANNCVNCHSFARNSPDKFLLHVRGSAGGTYFVNGKEVLRVNLQTEKMPANAVYPAWHPSGKWVVFSSNKTVQSFHMRPEKNIEVYDLFSSLVIYDTEYNKIYSCAEKDTVKYMETFPCWSPSGDCLYYCRTRQVEGKFDYRDIRYDLVKRSFDMTSGSFGKTEIVFNAAETGKSVSYPAVSPDGRYLVFTLHNYGTFSIWHSEADLYLLDLETGKSERMDLNSNETESYHSWSSNGKWLVFSSKRGDGLTARPYLAYFGSPGNVGKPFVLPQKDPGLYKRLAKTFNRPEFVTGRIEAGPRDFAKASLKKPVRAVWLERN
jgi:WD40 repeat protein